MIIVLQIFIGLFIFYLVWTIIRKIVSAIIFFIKVIIDENSIRKVYRTIDFIVMDFMSKIGRAILFVGKIGSGKTTQQALFTHYATIDCWTETRKVCDDFRDEFTEIDFTLLNVEIEKLYDDYRLAMENDPEINYHFKNLFDVLADKYCDLLADRFIDDGVTRTYFYDAFYKYVFAYCRVKNNHFVVANTQVYSYITNNYALGFTGNMMSLKEMYDNESLYFDEYMVIVKDENSADPDDYYLNYQSIYKDDNGKHLFIRFIRHLFEGTVRFCTTDQDATGMVANQRKIMDTFIYVMGLKIKCERPTLTKFILNLKTFVRDFEQFYARFFKTKKKRDHYLNNNNNFKRFIKFLMKIQRYLYSKAMVEYTDRIYQDMAKKDGEIKEWDFAGHPSEYVVLNLGTNDATAIMLSSNKEEETETFRKKYLEFIKNIRSLNGADTWIVCALGSMDYYLYHDIVEIVEAYKKESRDTRISTFRYKKMAVMDPMGACAHPHLVTQQKMAKEIAEEIKRIEAMK